MHYPLYVVKKTFKAGGQLFRVGSLLENLSDVKLAKIRRNEGYIIPIPTDTAERERLCHYYEVRFGVDLAGALAARTSKGSEVAEPENPVAKAPTPPGTPAVKAAVAKPAAKVVTGTTKVTPKK